MEFTIFSNIHFNSLFEISTCSLVCRWYGVAILLVTPYLDNTNWSCWLWKCFTPSLIVTHGTSNLVKVFFLKNFTITRKSFIGKAATLTHLETKSVATRINCLLNEDGKGRIKSIPYTLKSSTSKMLVKGVSCLLEMFPILWHLSQVVMNV